jgi:hypothetical protein
MRKYLLGVAALILLMGNPASADEGQGVTPMLRMDTTYYFVLGTDFRLPAAFPGRPSSLLWALTWEGTVEGDINGVIRWWAEFTPPLSFAGTGRWEIWDCASPAPTCFDPSRLIMAGYDVFGYVSDVDWEGKGIVAYVGADYPEYAEWFGRRITDGGWVDFTGLPYGEGWFTIYNKPSNKH